jgi:hypothetical protein
VKRSKSIHLVLIGGVSAGALAGCKPQPPGLNAQNYYTNNHAVPGAGYYHAPFRAWYPLPYNHFDPQSRSYFYGGQWAATPHESITNISLPALSAVHQAQAQAQSAVVARGGFGGSSRSHHIWS